jgi:hypothetical protein
VAKKLPELTDEQTELCVEALLMALARVMPPSSTIFDDVLPRMLKHERLWGFSISTINLVMDEASTEAQLDYDALQRDVVTEFKATMAECSQVPCDACGDLFADPDYWRREPSEMLPTLCAECSDKVSLPVASDE